MRETCQPAVRRPAARDTSAEDSTTRRIKEAFIRYEDITDLADLEDPVDGDEEDAHPVEYRWDNPIGLVIEDPTP
ncbi:MAG: hypothetical protein OXU64_02100 [Gemmatimonadota bacterium]|nr:hypothetical protein [Gemmatimonadota bacterium]